MSIQRFVLLTSAILVAALSGCAKASYLTPEASPPTGGTSIGASFRADTEVDADGAGLETRAIIRTGDMTIRVREEMEQVKAEIERIVDGVKGRVQSFTMSEDRRLSMTLHVPQVELEGTMDRMAGLGRVTRRSLTSRDVTEQMIDIEARLRNLIALRDRLRGYLDKAVNLKQILDVERELTRVQTEIEAIEARLRMLRGQVAMSRLDLTVRRR